jgi:hypothetical protein
MTEHEVLSLSPLALLTVSATRAASVKASLTPRFFIAEHSVEVLVACDTSAHRRNPNLPRYRNAFTLSATARPCL